MEISVVMPCHNAAEVLATQLESLTRQRCEQPWEVVVVDDGSVDGTTAAARSFAERLTRLRVVRHERRRGAAHARNTGAAVAAGDRLIFVDADDASSPEYVAALGSALQQHELVCPVTDFTTLNQQRMVKASPRPHSDGPSRMFRFLPHAGGGAIGIRRDVFDAVGGFDPSLPWLHDADLCWRVQLQFGVPLWVVEEAVSYVRLRASLRGLYRQGVANGRDGIRLRRRYAPHGVPLTPWSRHLRQWLKTARALGRAGSLVGRHEFAWRLGKQVGRFTGMVEKDA